MTPATLLALLEQRATELARRVTQGDPGPPGEQGPSGVRGFVGRQGPQGARGFQGVTGLKGEQGKPGPRGNDGRDATAGSPQPATKVTPAKVFGLDPVVGVAPRWAHEDHGHGTPPEPRPVFVGGGGGGGAQGQAGVQGPAGPAGPQNLYIQDTEPTTPGVFLWINTTDDTLWYHDGVVA